MYNLNFHKSIENDEIPQAYRLGEFIKLHYNPGCFVDFGCSTGIYLKEVQNRCPNATTYGLEFSEDAVQNAVCPNVIHHDLTQPIKLDRKSRTLGLCLEVLEHIDDANWRPVLENIVNNCDTVIFSAAHIGQSGTGHINCRAKIDWIKRFHELGWVVHLDDTIDLFYYMKQGYHMGWLIQNAMVLTPYKNYIN